MKIGPRNFNKSEFKNLIGRVCRFSEIFEKQTGNLRMLEPHIYLIKSDYESKNTNQSNFLSNTAKIDLKLTDQIDNILLKDKADVVDKIELQRVKDALEYLENIEPNTVDFEEIEYFESKIAKLCYKIMFLIRYKS